MPPALSTHVPLVALGLKQYCQQVPCAFGCRSLSTGTPRKVAPPPCWCIVTVCPVGLMIFTTRSPMNECSMFTQMESRSFIEFNVCPAANWVKVSSALKQDPTSSGKKTPLPRSPVGSSLNVVAFTTASKHSVSPTQPSTSPPVPMKSGSVPTSTSRSTRLVLAHPLLSTKYNCAVYAPGAE